MTKETAEKIREARLNGSTWRAIARDFSESGEDNQIEGMDLCREAAEVLGEGKRPDLWN